MLSGELLAASRQLAAKRWVVAFSGGLDSTVLLHWLAAEVGDIALSAVHVNHGLQAGGDSWAEHCQTQCEQLAVPLRVERVRVDIGSGEGLEGAARSARYAALAKHVDSQTLLFTAHHADDQAESVLLALMRGSGSDGLAAMPPTRAFADGHLVRPLLSTGREELRQWARARKLNWIEDPSNSDETLRRNFIRRQVLPLLEQQWPAAKKNLVRAAGLQAEQRGLLEAHAAELLLAARQRAGSQSSSSDALSVDYLKSLGQSARKLLVRQWLREQGRPLPSQHNWSGLDETLAAAAEQSPVWHYVGGEVRRFQGMLYAVQPVVDAPVGEWHFSDQLCCQLPGDWGSITLTEAKPDAPDVIRLDPASLGSLRITFRRGGEKYLRSGQHRLLKQWFQQRIPPWQRNQTPLLLCGKELLAFGETVLADSDPRLPAYHIQWCK